MRARSQAVCAAAVATVVTGLLAAPPPVDAATTTVLVSVTSGERPVADPSVAPSISGDGARVAFQSLAGDLVPGDGNGLSDVFVRGAGTTRLVSGGRGGRDADGPSFEPSISSNGRFVAFTSAATNLVAADGNGVDDVFRRDLRTGRTVRVSLGLRGAPAGRTVAAPSISGNGSRVVFEVTYGDRTELYLRDVAAHTTRRVSVARHGGSANGSSFDPEISADGRFVAFRSSAANLVPDDRNGFVDAFRRNVRAGRTVLVSRDRAGQGADGQTFGGTPAISAGGRFVVFHSEASDLVRNDTNGEPDVFRRDLRNGATRIVSVTSDEEQVTGFGSFHTVGMDVSAAGRYVTFSSDFSGLTPDDDNGQPDVFLRDVVAGTTQLVSRGTDGTSPGGFSLQPSMNRDGRFVAFSSDAPDVTTADTNGEVNDVFRAELR